MAKKCLSSAEDSGREDSHVASSATVLSRKGEVYVFRGGEVPGTALPGVLSGVSEGEEVVGR